MPVLFLVFLAWLDMGGEEAYLAAMEVSLLHGFTLTKEADRVILRCNVGIADVNEHRDTALTMLIGNHIFQQHRKRITRFTLKETKGKFI